MDPAAQAYPFHLQVGVNWVLEGLIVISYLGLRLRSRPLEFTIRLGVRGIA